MSLWTVPLGPKPLQIGHPVVGVVGLDQVGHAGRIVDEAVDAVGLVELKRPPERRQVQAMHAVLGAGHPLDELLVTGGGCRCCR